jgi:hypothetical protein
MALLLSQEDQLGMDYQYLGDPFIHFSTSLDTGGMDYQYLGDPFVINGSAISKIKNVHTTPWGNIKKFHGTNKSGIKTFGSTPTT